MAVQRRARVPTSNKCASHGGLLEQKWLRSLDKLVYDFLLYAMYLTKSCSECLVPMTEQRFVSMSCFNVRTTLCSMIPLVCLCGAPFAPRLLL